MFEGTAGVLGVSAVGKLLEVAVVGMWLWVNVVVVGAVVHLCVLNVGVVRVAVQFISVVGHTQLVGRS